MTQITSFDKNIRKNPESVDIGFAANYKLEQIKSSLNSAKILESKKQPGDFLAQLLHHLLEKSPLKYAVVHSTVCLNLVYMRNPAKKSSCESQMDILLQKFVSLGRISARSAELEKQYQKFFIVIDQNQQLFSSFNPTNDGVDTLFLETMGSSDEYGDLWEFVEMFLILFHGLSEVERGFSVNKQLLIENFKTKSLVAFRRIENHEVSNELKRMTQRNKEK